MQTLFTLCASLLAGSTLAAGQHAGHHDHRFGKPGEAAAASRTIAIEACDQMRFVHAPFEIRQGEPSVSRGITAASCTMSSASVTPPASVPMPR